MNDLVDRLRAYSCECGAPLQAEAADEIERLESKLTEINAGCDIQRGNKLFRQVQVVIGPGKTQDQLTIDNLRETIDAMTVREKEARQEGYLAGLAAPDKDAEIKARIEHEVGLAIESLQEERKTIEEMARFAGWRPEIEGEKALADWIGTALESEQTDATFQAMKRREAEADANRLAAAGEQLAKDMEAMAAGFMQGCYMNAATFAVDVYAWRVALKDHEKVR